MALLLKIAFTCSVVPRRDMRFPLKAARGRDKNPSAGQVICGTTLCLANYLVVHSWDRICQLHLKVVRNLGNACLGLTE